MAVAGKRGGGLRAPAWRRLWMRVDRSGECWNWVAGVNDSGYGVIWDGYSRVYVHRLSYELHGFQVPDDMELDHLCFNKRCVRPDHLEVVTKRVNVQRAHKHRVYERGWTVSPETRERMRAAQRARREREKAA